MVGQRGSRRRVRHAAGIQQARSQAQLRTAARAKRVQVYDQQTIRKIAGRRLARDLQDWPTERENIEVKLNEGNPLQLDCVIPGGNGTPWEGKMFTVSIDFSVNGLGLS